MSHCEKRFRKRSSNNNNKLTRKLKITWCRRNIALWPMLCFSRLLVAYWLLKGAKAEMWQPFEGALTDVVQWNVISMSSGFDWIEAVKPGEKLFILDNVTCQDYCCTWFHWKNKGKYQTAWQEWLKVSGLTAADLLPGPHLLEPIAARPGAHPTSSFGWKSATGPTQPLPIICLFPRKKHVLGQGRLPC